MQCIRVSKVIVWRSYFFRRPGGRHPGHMSNSLTDRIFTLEHVNFVSYVSYIGEVPEYPVSSPGVQIG